MHEVTSSSEPAGERFHVLCVCTGNVYRSRIAEDELRRVFNLGIGYLAVVREPGDDLVIGRIVAE